MGLVSRLKALVASTSAPASATPSANLPPPGPLAPGPAPGLVGADAARSAGNAALQAGHVEEALRHYDVYAALRPDHGPAHVARAFALMELRRSAEAAVALRAAVRLDPTSHEAHFLLARALAETGDASGAEAAFAESVRLEPDFAHAWYELGQLRERSAALALAGEAYGRAAQIDPAFAPAWEGAVRVALLRNDGAAALPAADRLVALSPSATALGMRADALLKLDRPVEALQAAQRATAMDADAPQVQLILAAALQRLRRHEEATAILEGLLRRDRGDTALSVEFATALISLERHEEALTLLDVALAAEPADSAALYNQGLALMQLRRVADARRALAEAVRLRPEDPRLHFALAGAVLASGEMTEGWRLYEFRKQPPFEAAPRWLPGQPVAGKRVLLISEQGLGDAIHFARYAPRVAALGAQAVLLVAKPLKPLLEGVWPGCEITVDVATAGKADLYCPLMSLPHTLGLAEPLPMSQPYLRADASRLGHWNARLGQGAALRVGLVWSGNPAHPDDRRRSMSLEPLRAAFCAAEAAKSTRGIQFVSLQLELREGDRAALAAWPGLVDTAAEQRGLADTAALIEALDAVLCVDTSVAHLAGALGRPVFVMLHRNCDWRWGLAGTRTPWYPSARLVRQERPGDWQPVFEQAIEALAALRRPA